MTFLTLSNQAEFLFEVSSSKQLSIQSHLKSLQIPFVDNRIPIFGKDQLLITNQTINTPIIHTERATEVV